MKNIIRSIGSSSPLLGRVFPGWELISVNGKIIVDVMDYKFYTYDRSLLMEFRTAEGNIRLVRVRKEEGSDPGLEFETYLMDRPRSCANRCIFCFIDQNPPGMRKSIYFKDDDARLSFLMGCYITLTNLTEREIQRIMDLHISPVNISVHTTDPVLRETMLRSPRAGEIMGIMGRFAKAGITMNCQIVCCPGRNDGAALERSLTELRGLFPAVNSISVVPVGLTKHRSGLEPLEPFTREAAEATVALVEGFGEQCLKDIGTRLAFCSDELYLRAGRALPPDEYYETHTQLENGVGMLRLLEAEFKAALRAAEEPDGAAFTVATGAAAAPMLESLLAAARERFPGLKGQVVPVQNAFYGESVTVAGLLTGRDLLAQLRDRDLGERVLISREMLRRDEVDFLDCMTLAELSGALGVPVYPVSCDGGALCDAVFGLLPEIPVPAENTEETEYCPYNQSERKGG